MNVLASSIMDFSMDMPILEKILFSLAVSAIGIIIVFAVLILIMCVIYLFQAAFGQKVEKSSVPEPKPVVVETAKQPVVATAVNPEEMVAAIAAATAMAQEELIVVLSAAVAAQEGCDPASSRYRIRSFRRIL